MLEKLEKKLVEKISIAEESQSLVELSLGGLWFRVCGKDLKFDE